MPDIGCSIAPFVQLFLKAWFDHALTTVPWCEERHLLPQGRFDLTGIAAWSRKHWPNPADCH
ncbi:MAG TPA: hypothetical protein PLN42_10520, partial [Anaerolineae bacterium]|nr:hypothetical protein [Anaerolineae bacterium]